MSETGTRRLVLASTCGVYGDQVTQPINESAAAAPTSPYGTSKLAADNVAMDMAGTGAIGAASLRAFNIAGAFPGHPDPDETRLIPRMMAVQRGTAPELADLAPLHPMFVEEPVLPEFTHRIGDVVQASPSRTPGRSPRSGGSRRSRRPSTRCWPRTAPRAAGARREPAGGLRDPELPDPGRASASTTTPGPPNCDYVLDRAPFAFRDGAISRWDAPGLGVEIDEDAVREADRRGHRS